MKSPFPSLPSPKRRPKGLARVLRTTSLGLALAGTGFALATACLDRPVIPADPSTSNVYVDKVVQTAIDKIDLLFTIDNSISMADKQAMLRLAVPSLLNRLITPLCVDEDGNTQPQNGGCPPGFIQEFKPVNDIHIGVVTSSLGGHGGNVCGPEETAVEPSKNDRGMLLSRGITSPTGFLAWTGAPQDAQALVTEFQTHATAAGEQGCGFEATLESWYRFMADPEPPAEVVYLDGKTVAMGVNEALLVQRKAFLRPDSLVAIIMLSDENDCSIVDAGQGWLISSTQKPGTTNPWIMPHGTAVCDSNPNDPCCRSCGAPDPAGCTAGATDPGCMTDPAYDTANLRCHAQRRRFGIDLLYPTQRYVDALTQDQLPARDGSPRPNPLYFNDQGVPRSKSLVFLAGIIGVPWQDVATDETLMTPDKLKYLNANELQAKGRWDVIVGDVNANVPPTDPFMVEQSAPRSGANPITASPICGATDQNPRCNPINGHEYDTQGTSAFPDDLQYACIYQLTDSRDCATAGAAGCDCKMSELGRNKPLCNPVNGGTATTVQTFAKAYPGLRELEVLKGYARATTDANSIVASICPKVTSGETTNENFGYNPAVGAIIDRLKVFLNGRCLPRALQPDDDGLVPCAVVEASKAANCSLPGRVAADDQVAPAVRKQLEESGSCKGTADCNSWKLCEILPAGKSSANGAIDRGRLEDCQNNDPVAAGNVGYCYIDEALDIGSPNLVKDCPATERRLLRFIGENTPAKGALTFIACIGESLEDDDAGTP